MHRLRAPLPYEDGFNEYDNNYSKGAFSQIYSEYGADSKALYKFESQSSAWDELSHDFWVQRKGDYAKWIIPTSNGLTLQGLTKLSESIRLYARLLLGSQSQGRASILGNDASSFTVRQMYLQQLENVIKRPENLQDDINNFQGLLKYVQTPVNLVIVPKCYMIPSEMNLKIGQKIEKYNNNILNAPEDSNVGEINSMINHKVKDLFQSKQLPHDRHAAQQEQKQALPPHDRPHEIHQAKQHEEEKQALIIGCVSLILFGFYLFRENCYD